MPNKGYMIAIEGADKAGKSTQIAKIIKDLNSRDIPNETIKFPQYEEYFGLMVKEYLNGGFGDTRQLPDKLTMLPYALDRQAAQPKIKKWLKEGKVIIIDRYTYSNAFSIAKCDPEIWPTKIEFLKELEFKQMGIRKPDCNIFLSVDPKISFDMKDTNLKDYQNGKADIHESDAKLLADVSRVYHLMAKLDPKNWIVIDQMKPGNVRMNEMEVFNILGPIIHKLIQR